MAPFPSAPGKQKQEAEDDHTQEGQTAHGCRYDDSLNVYRDCHVVQYCPIPPCAVRVCQIVCAPVDIVWSVPNAQALYS